MCLTDVYINSVHMDVDFTVEDGVQYDSVTIMENSNGTVTAIFHSSIEVSAVGQLNMTVISVVIPGEFNAGFMGESQDYCFNSITLYHSLH